MKTLTQNPAASAVRSAAHWLCTAVVCFTSLAIQAGAQTPDVIVDTLSERHGVVFTRSASYDYVPSIMKQGGYRMWWCGGFGGDSIFYAESSSIAGPWHNRTTTTADTWIRTFWGTKNGNSFDSEHTCDPSVILHEGKYYLYYGGLPQSTDASFNSITRIGVARSDDGVTVNGWTRLNGGLPIISPKVPMTTTAWVSGGTYVWGDRVLYSGKEYVCKVVTTSSVTNPSANTAQWRKQYGAGQPSVVAGNDGWIYIFFTDSTAADSLIGNGAGVYVLRSKDPEFQIGVEELQSTGWQSIVDTDSRLGTYCLINSFSVDAVYSDVLEQFIVAAHEPFDNGKLYFFSNDLTVADGTLLLAYNDENWSEGPGIVRGPEGRALPGAANDLARIPFDIIYSYQTTVSPPKDPSKYDLYHVGYDLIADVTQNDLDARVGALFRGWKLECTETPALPLVYVSSEATRLQCESSNVPDLLTDNLYDISDYYFYEIPFGAVLRSGSVNSTAWTATAREPGFIMNFDTTRIWRVNDTVLMTANGTTLTTESQANYDLKSLGPVLYKTLW